MILLTLDPDPIWYLIIFFGLLLYGLVEVVEKMERNTKK